MELWTAPLYPLTQYHMLPIPKYWSMKMRELTQNELATASGGIAPVIVVAVAGATLYGAAKSIYEFGKVLGGLIVEIMDDTQKVEA
ncbi:MAG: lactobin A/cerein 7B family class IIb bacteriocin [Candidatus Azotimanducaceae bacterium]|jgi:lactobin A/cerein 7B family class IIb bacteriocin